MAAQKNYSFETPKGVPGGKVDIGFDDVVTRANEEKDGVLKYGMAVATGTNAGSSVKVPTTGTTKDQIEGVAVALPNTEHDTTGTVVVKSNASLSVMKKGRIWGRLASDVTATAGATAYVVTSGDDAGCFTATASGALDIGAKFGKWSDDEIAVIELN